MEIPLQVLIVQDKQSGVKELAEVFSAAGYAATIERVSGEEKFQQCVLKQSWDVILCDDESKLGVLDALSIVNKNHIDTPFIVISSQGGEENAVKAMRAGAHDYMVKGQMTRLVPALEREMREMEVRSARREADATVERLTHRDSLTGLPNRVLFYDRLQQVLRNSESVAVLLMDLDRFKDINDSIGHYYGDILLQQVAGRLRQVDQEWVSLARMGGDEFGLVVACDNTNQAVTIAQQVLKIFDEDFQLNGHKVIIGASVGIAMAPQHGNNADLLLKAADVAMYSAKKASSDYALYNIEQDERQNDQASITLLDDLKLAIDKDQLVVHYQPKVDIKTRTIAGVEALVRWVHPIYGSLAPIDFLPRAEHTNLIRKLSMWVLGHALEQLAEWHRSGLDFTLAVNIPVRTLHDADFMDHIKDKLNLSGIMANHLELEITERTMMVDLFSAMEVLNKISDLGVNFTIDDFGTGHFSLGYLKKLPIDTIKVDKSFVLAMASDEDSADLVKASVALGQTLGLKVLAEGVENRDIWDLLVVYGCDLVQGNFVSHPLPADEFPYWLKHSPWNLDKAKVS